MTSPLAERSSGPPTPHLPRLNGVAVNLAGDYTYLEDGYYVSQDLERAGEAVYPTCRDALDAYVVPLCLVRARREGIAAADHYVSNGYVEPPAIVDTMNPFMQRSAVLRKKGRREQIARSLTRNYTYALCCQDLPAGARVHRFRAVLGRTGSRRYAELAAEVWEVFRIPLARIRVLRLPDESVLLSAIGPLPLPHLNRTERALLQEALTWPA